MGSIEIKRNIGTEHRDKINAEELQYWEQRDKKKQRNYWECRDKKRHWNCKEHRDHKRLRNY
jgi:hypothetical protein